MERLTKRTAAGTPNLDYPKSCYYENGDKDQVAVSAFRQRAIDRLARYEDLEENGRLHISNAYRCPKCGRYELTPRIDYNFYYCFACKKQFTREEAEAALERMVKDEAD